jgi:hypothetical protein
MDWEQGRWDSTPRPVAAPTFNDQVIWRVTRDTRWAEARIREVPHGRELRFIVGGAGREDTLMHSNVLRDAQALADYSTGIRQTGGAAQRLTSTRRGWASVE